MSLVSRFKVQKLSSSDVIVADYRWQRMRVLRVAKDRKGSPWLGLLDTRLTDVSRSTAALSNSL